MKFSELEIRSFDLSHNQIFKDIVTLSRKAEAESRSTRNSILTTIAIIYGILILINGGLAINPITIIGILLLIAFVFKINNPIQAYEDILITNLKEHYKKLISYIIHDYLVSSQWTHCKDFNNYDKKSNHLYTDLDIINLNPQFPDFIITRIKLKLYSNFNKSKEIFSESHFLELINNEILNKVKIENWNIAQVSATKYYEFKISNSTLELIHSKNKPLIKKSNRDQAIKEYLSKARIKKEDSPSFPVEKINPISNPSLNYNLVSPIRKNTELTAMDYVLQYENINNRHPFDVSSQNLGYDIKSCNTSMCRYIEVKGLAKTGTVFISENEKNFLISNKDAYLYIVSNCDTDQPNLSIYKDFNEESFMHQIVSFKVNYKDLTAGVTEECLA